ncbi:methyltransferase family protein [Chloroflexota bacterium]
MVYRYIIIAAACVVIWVINGRHIFQSTKRGLINDIYAHIGLGIFFTLIALEYALSGTEVWQQWHVSWLRILGFALYAPSVILVIGSIIQLHRKGQAEQENALSEYGTTAVVDSGVYRLVQHPMWLGMIIWSVALMAISQSVIGIVMGVVAANLFRMAAIREREFNIQRFGESYRNYINRVPMWNIFTGLRK